MLVNKSVFFFLLQIHHVIDAFNQFTLNSQKGNSQTIYQHTSEFILYFFMDQTHNKIFFKTLTD